MAGMQNSPTDPLRIVSLLAAATEIVCALGYRQSLVGCSHECDYPPEISRLPRLTTTRVEFEESSHAINRQVRELVEQALSPYWVDVEQLGALAPNVIITQTQCAVCAVSESDVEEALRQWTKDKPRLVSLHPGSLNDIWRDITRIAESLGVPAAGESLVVELQSRIGLIAERAKALAKRPQVAAIEWIDPLMAAGNWLPELMAAAGGEEALGQAAAKSHWISVDDLQGADPDMIVVLPCGFDLARSQREMPTLADRREWQSMRAVRSGQVYLADGQQFFNRSGPRVVESVEILAEILHPEAFHFGHQGSGWIPYRD